MTPLRVGIIGAGRIGTVHAETVQMRIPSARVTSICDVNLDAAQKLGARLGVTRITAYDQEVVKDRDLDAVFTCSATDTHSRLIEQAAASGKAIFCEKPVDADLGRIDAALAAVDKAKVPLQIGFNRRFDPNFAHVQKVVAEGGIGRPQILRITSRDPSPPPIAYVKVSGGMFFDMTIHDFDMARFLVGDEVESIYACGGVMVDPEIGKAGDIDTAVITLQFRNGTIGTIDNSRQAVYGYDQRVEVFGSEGVIRAENETPTRTIHGTRTQMVEPLPLHFFMQRYVASYQAEIEQFVAAVQGKKPTPVTGRDGRVPVVMAMAAIKSLKEGRPVRLAEVG